MGNEKAGVAVCGTSENAAILTSGNRRDG